MKVSIFGLGYVGCVSIACLSREGHQAIGVDVMKSKVDAIRKGLATVVEPEVDELITTGHENGTITATTEGIPAVLETDATLICVGTPTGKTGEHDLAAVKATADLIGQALLSKPSGHLVVMRSTVAPGTVQEVLVPRIKRADNPYRDRISVVIIPEFLREGTAVKDYYNPPLIVVGTEDAQPDVHQGAIAELMAVEPEKIRWVEFRQAEMLKGLCNVFHALKVAFANEVGALCQELGIDGRAVMSLLTQDRKLNISPAYLRPGLPYGGSCLPKDLSAICALAQRNSLEVPLLQAIATSNEAHKSRAFAAVREANGHRRIGLDGLAFKEGTDDLRESPMVNIAEYLLGKGYDLRIYDPAVKAARLTGANREYIDAKIPHLADRLVDSVEELVQHSEALVLTRDHNQILSAAEERESPPVVIDLTGAGRSLSSLCRAGHRVETH